MLNATWWFWRNRGPLFEGRDGFARALAITGDQEQQEDAQRWAVLLAADLAMVQGDFRRAVAGGLSALAQWRRHATSSGRVRAWLLLGLVLVGRRQDRRARLVLTRVAAIFRETGETDWLANTLLALAVLALRQSDLTRAAALLDESLHLCEATGFRWGTAEAYEGLGAVARARGDLAASTAWCRQGLHIYREHGDPWGLAGTLEQLAINTARQGDPRGGARFFDAAERLRHEAALRPASTATHHEERIDAIATARAALGEPDFAAAWRAGQSMPVDQAVADAMTPAAAPGSRDAATATTAAGGNVVPLHQRARRQASEA